MKATRLLALAGLVCTIAGCSFFDYSSMVSKRYALVYGVSRYVTSAAAGTTPNLSYPAIDAGSMATLLQGEGYLVTTRSVDYSGNVIVSTIDSSFDQVAPPDKAAIQGDIQHLAPLVGPNDVVLLYFSGHGMQDTSTSPSHEWFVPYGGVDPSTFNGIESASVEDNELGSMLGVLGTPRKVVVLDTCNSGGFIGNSLEVDAMPPSTGSALQVVTPAVIAQAIANYITFQASPDGVSPYGGATVLSAAGADESSYETSSLGHGVMTYYLLQTPQTGDLNTDGHVTVLEAFSVVKAGIDANWNANSSVRTSGMQFEPHVSGGPVDFVIF